MKPREYELFVGDYFRQQGYRVEITPETGDWGVDIFAWEGDEKIAIQVKNYGGGTRKINRQMVMELCGAKEYFDCTRAIMVTSGSVMDDAEKVAKKLGIKIIYLGEEENKCSPVERGESIDSRGLDFDSIWSEYIIPLAGKTLKRENGEENKILEVNWGEVKRITSNGNEGKIRIEIFKYAVNKILKEGYVTRDDINQNYAGRASSGVVLILSQVPFFELTKRPTGLRLVNLNTK
ncbi:restriction endonuclease [uncultured Butyricimonas sp.]|uniref:restriction endonuclease n=2 Tax=Butyricimonas TaxID=574697 RepID=UPI0026DAC27A|nr:restriction endonuclease [uncultured Butyricimonas sp.]